MELRDKIAAFETEDVQELFVAGAMITGAAYKRDEARGWFAEWLAQVRAEAQVEALREAADSLDTGFQDIPAWTEAYEEGVRTPEWMAGGVRMVTSTIDVLTARADRIAREAGIETGESND